jgi:WD40 repeat protein
MSYTKDELYLVSAGADHTILVWDLSVFSVTRTLRGHSDVINGYVPSIRINCVISIAF